MVGSKLGGSLYNQRFNRLVRASVPFYRRGLRDWTLTWLAMAEGLESRIESQTRAGMSSCLMLRTRAASFAHVCTGKKVLQDECAARVDQAFEAEVEGAWWWGWRKLGASQAGCFVSTGSPGTSESHLYSLMGAWCRL